MMTSSDHELLRETKVLARRYGAAKCQKALDAATAEVCLAPKVAGTSRKWVKPVTINPTFRVESSISSLLRFTLFSSSENAKMNLTLHHDAPPNVVAPLLTVLDDYYDSIVVQQQQRQIDPLSTKVRRVESRFHTLFLYANKTHTMYSVLDRTKCVALFERVFIGPQSMDTHSPLIGDEFFNRIVDLVMMKEGALISSLVFSNCVLQFKQALRLARLLETNHLESIELSGVEIKKGDIVAFERALLNSLRHHVKTFPRDSILKGLYLIDAWDTKNNDHLPDLFRVIGSLPRLESVTIRFTDPMLLNTLAGRIGTWKIRHFRLLCSFWVGDEAMDFRPLFHAMAHAGHIKVFSISCIPMHIYLPQFISRQLFELAFLPNSGLLDMDLRGAQVDLQELSSLVPDDVDPPDVNRRTLRQFDFVKTQMTAMFEAGVDEEALLANVEALLRLLSTQLPYLHSIGLTNSYWRYYQSRFCPRESLTLHSLWNQVLVQMEKNRVGMALFDAPTLSTVPAGLWPLVLNKAVTHHDDPKQLPWNGIYHMVRELFKGGHSGWSEGGKKRWGSQEERHDDDNQPKKIRAK